MSVYLGYDSVTKEYLKSLAGTGSGSGGTNVLEILTWVGMRLWVWAVHQVEFTNKKYVDDKIAAIPSTGGGGLSASGFTMTGDIDMNDNEVTGLDTPSTNSSAVSKKYVADNFLSLNGDRMNGNVDMERGMRLQVFPLCHPPIVLPHVRSMWMTSYPPYHLLVVAFLHLDLQCLETLI